MKMKKHLFTSWLAVGVLALGFAACASEDNAGKGEPKKTDTIPLAMGKPLRGFIDSTVYKASLASPAKQSRMTGLYGNISTGGTGIKFFFDKQEDYVDNTGSGYNGRLRVNMGTDAAPRWIQFGNSGTYTENGVPQPYTQSIETDADGNVLSALFHSTSSGEHLTKDSYKVRYGYYTASNYNDNTSNYITIASDQYQSSPGKAMRLAQYGDYATATAEDNGLYYDFVLKHHNAFITFMPYAAAGDSHDALAQCKLWRVRISSDQVMSTTFYVDDNGLKTDNWPTGGSKYIDLYCSENSSLSASSTLNYNIAASEAAAKTKGAIMVLAPGTYTNVKIEYYVYDNVVQNMAVFTKEIPSLTLTPGKNRPIYSEIKCKTENSTTYHEWGAMGPYWNAVNPEPTNWSQNGVSGTGYPQAGSLGYRSDVNAWDKLTDDAPTGSIDASSSPTANMMHWYIMHGDARYDNAPFIYRNHLFVGRIWFLKAAAMTATYGKSVAEMSAQALLSNGSYVDLSTNGRTDSYSMNPWSAVAQAARSNYFYILPLGCYYSGTLYYMSSASSGDWRYHSYWTRTAYPYTTPTSHGNNKLFAYQLRITYYHSSYTNISSGRVSLEYQPPVGNYREVGYPAWPGENNVYVP
ncbi:MAG: hypothetical protein ACFNVH_02715 [Segatella maculosa]